MKNRFILLLTICLLHISIISLAQYDVTKIDKKAVATYEKAMEFADASKYNESIALLQQAIARDENYVDAYLSLAGIYGQLKDYNQSVQLYEKAFVKDTAYTSDFWLPYAINLAGKGEFERALQTINKLLQKPNLHSTTQKAAEYRQNTVLVCQATSRVVIPIGRCLPSSQD